MTYTFKEVLEEVKNRPFDFFGANGALHRCRPLANLKRFELLRHDSEKEKFVRVGVITPNVAMLLWHITRNP